jgi:hypothetical protein
MNVQEDGASSFLLLPSTDDAGKSYVGSIDVSTLGGTVTLNKAYEATTVTSAIAAPTPPQVIKQDGPAVKEEKKDKDDLEKDNNAEDNNDKQKLEDIEIKRKEKQIMNTFLKMDDGRYVFFSKDKDNLISLIVQDGANVTVNYDNSGSIINAKMNSGNNVLFNIKQQ